MACDAAIKAVRDIMPAPASFHRLPLPGMTPQEIHRRINWWTLETICEAIVVLIERKEAAASVDDDGVIRYRRPNARQLRDERHARESLGVSHVTD